MFGGRVPGVVSGLPGIGLLAVCMGWAGCPFVRMVASMWWGGLLTESRVVVLYGSGFGEGHALLAWLMEGMRGVAGAGGWLCGLTGNGRMVALWWNAVLDPRVGVGGGVDGETSLLLREGLVAVGGWRGLRG